jgi:uncharacterized membrane protein
MKSFWLVIVHANEIRRRAIHPDEYYEKAAVLQQRENMPHTSSNTESWYEQNSDWFVPFGVGLVACLAPSLLQYIGDAGWTFSKMSLLVGYVLGAMAFVIAFMKSRSSATRAGRAAHILMALLIFIDASYAFVQTFFY